MFIPSTVVAMLLIYISVVPLTLVT
jgi:hypothetical protein